MGKNTDFNRAAGSIYWTAMHAAQALAVTLPDAPPIPALPTWPLSLRALTWCKGVLASAEAASPDVAEPDRTALCGAIDGWRALLGKYGRMPPSMGYELKNFYAAVPTGKDAPDLDQHIAAALAANALTPSQAGHWRVRLGLPDQ